MTAINPREGGFGNGHDRAARERDVLRELLELSGRPGAGSAGRGEAAREAGRTEEERWKSRGSGGSTDERDER